MTVATWIALPLIAALIGWLTNFVAVRMIFRPHRPVNVLGLKIQGLLPKRREAFARSIAETIETHLFSASDVRRALASPEVHDRLLGPVRLRVDSFLRERLLGSFPALGMFLQGPAFEKIKASLIAEIEKTVEEGAQVVGAALDERLDLTAIVEEKIRGFDMAKLERIVLDVASRELRAIEVLGAVLGFLVGLLQLAILAVAS